MQKLAFQARDANSSDARTIGLVLKMFPRLSETFILNEVLELEKQGLSLRIFSLKRPVDAVFHARAASVRSAITYVPEKFHRAPLSVLRGQFHVWWHYHRASWHTLREVLRRVRSAWDLGALREFCQACCIVREMRGISHLHAHYANLPAKVAMLVHRITGASYSITTHAKDIFQNDPFASPSFRERLRTARFVVANSRFSAEHIRTVLGGHGRTNIVYNGLDLECFPMRKRDSTEPLILAVGRLVEKKGFSDLVAACEILKERGVRFTCELVGTGTMSTALKEKIRNCGVRDRVRMIGPLPQQVLRDHYQRARVFALPCIRAGDGDRDILPNVIKEAMAVGVPVVTTRLDGIEELIEDGVSGVLVPPGDPPALAASLELLLGDCALRRRLAAEARKVIQERFDGRMNFAQLKALLLGQLQTPAPYAPAAADNGPHRYEANCIC